MNVAYLLVSSAWLAGQAPPAPTTAPGAVQAAPIVTSGAGYGGAGYGGAGYGGAGYGGAGCGCDGCNTGGDACCGSSGGGFCHRFKNKMRGMFSRGGHHGGGACDCGSAAPAAPTCCAAPAVTTASCGCGTSDCCQSGGKHHFRNKMRGMFKRGHHGSASDCGCASDCGSGCGGGISGGCGAPYGAPQGGIYGTPGGNLGERIPAPKDGNLNKMPKGGSGEPPAKTGYGSQVQINVAPTAPIPAAAPALEAAPAAPAPAANTEERPF